MKRKKPSDSKEPKKKKDVKSDAPIVRYSERWYENSSSIREECLDIIAHFDRYSDEKVSEAVFDLYYVSQTGDEKYLFPLLNCGRYYVVCQAIHSLGRMKMYESVYPFLLDIIDNHNNDDFYDGLRDEAIFQISQYAKENKPAAEKIKSLFSDSVFNALPFGNQLSVLDGVCYITDVMLSKDEKTAFTNREYSPYLAEYESLRKKLTDKLDNHINQL